MFMRSISFPLISSFLVFASGLFILGCKNEPDVPAAGRYEKVDSSGNIAPANASQWSCTLDTDTDLLWEVKGQFSRRYFNAWYTNTTGVGPEAVTARGKCVWEPTYKIWIEDESCHTEGYADYINELALCGYSDWRVPTREELETILFEDLAPPHWSTDYFPNSAQMFNSWSATYDTSPPGFASAVRTLFEKPIIWSSQSRPAAIAVRLVRGTQSN